MKRYIIIAAVSVLIANGACKFDDPDDAYPYTSVLFPNQDYNRNLIVGEGLKLRVGISFTGLMSNDRDRTVQYIIDPSLIVAADRSELPPAYYTCGHASQITVPAGQMKGYLPVQLDSAAFLSDPKALTGEYILPVRLVSSSDVDSITEGLDFMRISISYYAKQHGNYTYEGSITRTQGSLSEDTTYHNIASEDNGIRFLETTGPTNFRMIADPTNSADPAKSDNFSLLLEAPVHGGGAVTVAADPLSAVVVTPDGESTYDAAGKTFRLRYRYTLANGTECRVSETLVFRNRIRDVQENGIYINEWRGISE